MSSWEATREKWEEYHMEIIAENQEAADKGDPAAMETVAYCTALIGYNCEERVIGLLKAASDAGRETASWKLADYYAYLDGEKHHRKIEHYCRLALAHGRIYSDKLPEWIVGNLAEWITEHHPEWCEMKEGILEDGSYYCTPTHRYGKDVFRGVGEKATRKNLKKKETEEALWKEADALFDEDHGAGFDAWRKLAADGNAHATNSVGYCYRNGFGVEKDLKKAVAYYELAIARGYPSYCFLGFAYDELGEAEKALDAFFCGAKADDAGCCAVLSEMVKNGDLFDGNSYVAAFLSARAFELDEAEGLQLAICYLEEFFFPIVHSYAKYCVEKSGFDKAILKDWGFEFPDNWEEIEAIKPRYPAFPLSIYSCKDAPDPKKMLAEGEALLKGDDADRRRGLAKIRRAAELGYSEAILSAFNNDVEGYEDLLRSGARDYGDLVSIEILAILLEDKIGSFYKDNPVMKDVAALWALRQKLHAHVEMTDDFKEFYQSFKEKYDAVRGT